LLKVFKTYTFGSFLALLIVLIAARFGGIITPVSLPAEEGGIGYVLVLEWLGASGLTIHILLSIQLFIQAILLNAIVNAHYTGLDRNLVPALIYILLSSISLEFFPNAAIIWGTTFMAIALYNFFKVSNTSEVSGQVFNVGFFTAVAAMFFQPFIWFLLFFILRIGSLKSVRLKDFFQILTGSFVAYFLIWTTAFLYDYQELFYLLQFEEQFNFIENITSVSDYSLWFTAAIFVLLVLYSFFYFGELTAKNSLIFKKKISLLNELLLFSFPVILFQRVLNFQDLMIVIPFLATLAGLAMALKRNALISESMHLLIWAVLLFLQYYFQA